MINNENANVKPNKKTNTIEKFIMIIGLEGAGRKSISKLLNESLEEYTIEYFRKLYKFTYNNTKFEIFKAGMETRYFEEPDLWNNYCTQCQGIIFVVDSSDTFLFNSACEELTWLLNQAKLNNKPLLIFANKSDISFYRLSDISEYLKLNSIVKDRKSMILFSSVVENTGITEGIAWIINNLNIK